MPVRPALATIATLAAALLTAQPAHADFLFGKTLSIEVQDTNHPQYNSTPIPFVVDNTWEVGVVNYPAVVNFNLKVTDDTITIAYPTNATFDTAAFNGYVIKAVSANTPAFGSITLDPATTLPGFTQSRLSLTPTAFFINVSGLQATAGVSQIVLNVRGVPEPTSLAMLAIGLGGTALFARRRITRRVSAG